MQTAADRNIYYKWSTTSSSTDWSGWDGEVGSPGVQIVSQPSIALQGVTWMVFATGADGNVYYKWSTTASPTGWSGWDGEVGSPGVPIVSQPAIALQGVTWMVFATGADGNIYYKWSTTASPTGWSGWDGEIGSPGVQIVSPPSAAFQSSNGSWLVFATGADGNVYYKWSTTTSPTGWSGWDGNISNPGVPIVSQPSVALQGVTWMVFVAGADGNVYYEWSTTATTSGWSGWDGEIGSGDNGYSNGPGTPLREYLYFNDRVVAIENGGF